MKREKVATLMGRPVRCTQYHSVGAGQVRRTMGVQGGSKHCLNSEEGFAQPVLSHTVLRSIGIITCWVVLSLCMCVNCFRPPGAHQPRRKRKFSNEFLSWRKSIKKGWWGEGQKLLLLTQDRSRKPRVNRQDLRYAVLQPFLRHAQELREKLSTLCKLSASPSCLSYIGVLIIAGWAT